MLKSAGGHPGGFHHTDTNGQLKTLLCGLYQLHLVSGLSELTDFHQEAVNDILKLPWSHRSSISFQGGRVILKTEHSKIEYQHRDAVLIRQAIPVVHEPVTDWRIVYSYKLSGKTKEDWFKTLGELREYFHEFKRRGELVGYVTVKNRPPGFSDHLTTQGKLYFWYRDHMSMLRWTEFENVFQMAEFFKENPPLARCVEYQPGGGT